MQRKTTRKLVPIAFTLGVVTTAFAATANTVPAPETQGAGGGALTEPPPTTSVQTAVNSATTAATTAAAGGFTDTRER